jgi:hypothetical protein
MAEKQTAIGAFVFGGLVLAIGAVVLFGISPVEPTARAALSFRVRSAACPSVRR